MAQNIDVNAFVNAFVNYFTYQYRLGNNKPAEGTSYVDALVDTAKKSFTGRMSKQDYLLYIVPGLLAQCIPFVGWIILPLPNCACSARRLHDLGMTGWISLVMCIPYVSILLAVYLCITDGQKEANQFGEAPAAPAAPADSAK